MLMCITNRNLNVFFVFFFCFSFWLEKIDADIPSKYKSGELPIGIEYFSDCNPILPLWEYIADGEPHVFEDPDKPGKYRIYIYGSHDTMKNEFCGTDLVVWSAPLEDLSNWRYDGVIYANNDYPKDLRLMYAPDIVEIDKNGNKRYYLYPNEQREPKTDVAVSDSPIGPFIKWDKTGLIGFDPAVLVDDDNRVYAYWGFKKSFAAELDPMTMCTLKSGTNVIENMVSSCVSDDTLGSTSIQNDRFRFYEASSIRKIGHMYVFIYARKTHPSENRGKGDVLAYAYSTNPLGPWTYGGIIISSGSLDDSYPTGNIHGSIVQLNGEWYVFYHRHTDNTKFARQACVEPIEVQVVGNTVIIEEVEKTSLGFNKKGLNLYKKYPAAIACYIKGGAYIKANYDRSVNCTPVVNITNGSIVGYKYYNFDMLDHKDCYFQLDMIPKGIDAEIDIMVDSPNISDNGIKLGTLKIEAKDSPTLRKYILPVSKKENLKGRRAIFLVFKSAVNDSICDLFSLKFNH